VNRLARIPEDVWEKLTISDAARAGLLGAFPDELARNKTDLLRDCGEWTMVARLLQENITTGTVQKACDIVRRREAITSDTAMNPLEHAQFVAAVFGTTDDEAARAKRERAVREIHQSERDMGTAAESTGHPTRQGPPRLPVRDRMTRPERIPPDVWETLTVGEAVEADLLGETALEMGTPETLCRHLESGSVLAKCLRDNIKNNSQEVIDRRVERVRQMRVHDKANRPRRIPADIWDAMTVREAHVHGFFQRPSDGTDLPQEMYLCAFPSDSRIATLLRNKLQRRDDESLDASFRAIRAERAQNARYAACPKHEPWHKGNACMHCGMRMDALDKHISSNVLTGYKWDAATDDRVRHANASAKSKRSFRCVKHEVYMTNGIASCSRCDASESEILDAEMESLDELDDRVARAISSALRKKQKDIQPDASVPDSLPKFREDICRNDGPLLPPFVIADDVGRVVVSMLYPYTGPNTFTARCSVGPCQAKHAWRIEYRKNSPRNLTPIVAHWNMHRSESNAARTRIADDVLSFDLAVRTGEFLAVAAYGLILFALSVGAEHERTRVRAVMSETDNAMDAVMRAAREVSEGE
jgi:hypothetical protein